jgi:hypothetical protein
MGKALTDPTASFAFTVKISAKREAPDVATFDESIAEGAMDEEKGATDGCLAAGRKLTGKVNEADPTWTNMGVGGLSWSVLLQGALYRLW